MSQYFGWKNTQITCIYKTETYDDGPTRTTSHTGD